MRIDYDVDAVQRELVVALLRAAIEAERVLEARAAAALDGDAQNRDLVLLGHELLDLVRSCLSERDQGVGTLDRCHSAMVATCSVDEGRGLTGFLSSGVATNAGRPSTQTPPLTRLCNTRS